MEIEAGLGNLVAGNERFFDGGTRAQIAGFHPDGGVAPSGLIKRIFENLVQVAIEFKGDTFS
jgi:hypothetical protein